MSQKSTPQSLRLVIDNTNAGVDDLIKPHGYCRSSEPDRMPEMPEYLPAVAQINLYEFSDFRGREWISYRNAPDLAEGPGELISSFIIVSGVWRFYDDSCFKGHYWDFGPGPLYMPAAPEDVLRSARLVAF